MTTNDPTSALLATLSGNAPVTVDCSAYPRLPVAFIDAAVKRPIAVALTNVQVDACWALHLLGLGERLRVDSPMQTKPRDIPFQLGMDGTGLLVSPDRTISQNKLLSDQVCHSWARGLLAETLTVDFAAVDQVNSMLVAWLLQLAQSARPAGMVVRNARAQILTQFKQLRLDQMMKLA